MANIDLSKYEEGNFEYGIGKLFYEKVADTGIGKGEIAIFDDASKNYHFYPKNKKFLKKWEEEIKEKKNAIENAIEEQIEANDTLIKVKSKEDLDNIAAEDKEKIHIWCGSRGTLKCEKKTICTLFKYIVAVKNGVLYELNFMRFYISNDNKVNCIFKSLQYDRVANPKKTVNQDEICYPTSYRGQSYETLYKLIENNKDNNFFYNPQVSFDAEPEEILKDFINFIKECEKYEKF